MCRLISADSEMGTKCKKCCQYEAEEYPTTGTVVCTNCGAVSEENQSKPTFLNRSNYIFSRIVDSIHRKRRWLKHNRNFSFC